MISNMKSLCLYLSISPNYRRRHILIIMMNNNANNEDLDRLSIYLRDIRSFPIIIFAISLMTAALKNTQAWMKAIADVLAFFAFFSLIIGIIARLIRIE
jgi:hypothetical protein